MSHTDESLAADDPMLWGGEAIGRAAGVVDKNGNVDIRRTYYLLQMQYLPARKVGNIYCTTLSQVRSVALPAAK